MNYRDTTANINNRNPFECHSEAKETSPRATEKWAGVSSTPATKKSP